MIGSNLLLSVCHQTLAWKRYAHSATRKELIPLIKRLHPDLMTHHTDAVKKANMICIQNLNDLWDTLETNVQATVGKNVAYGLDIKLPFRTQYDLACYLHNDEQVTANDTSSPPVKKHSIVISIPDALCKRQSISHKVFMGSIDLILQQQGMLFEVAGLDNPWTEPEALREVNETSSDGRRPAEELSSELETRLFERWLIKNSKLSGLRSKFDRKGRTNYSRVFGPQHSKNSASLDRLFGNRRAQDAMFADEVDAYLKAGNVVVSPMSPQEEFAAVKQLRQFFIDFGDVLNFGTGRWHTVYVMLHGYSGTERFQSKARLDQLKRRAAARDAPLQTQTQKQTVTPAALSGEVNQSVDDTAKIDSHDHSTISSEQQEQDEQDEQDDTVAMPVYYAGNNDGTDNGGYSVEAHGEHHLVRVPAGFKSGELLEFMRKVLPAARIDLS